MGRTVTGSDREAERKQQWHARKWAMAERAKQKPAPGAVTELDLPLDAIDATLTAAVRAGLNPDAVDEYADTEKEWDESAPIQVCAGPSKFFASDGGHRCAAKRKLGRKKIKCRVTKYATDGEAFVAARLASFAANHGHGLKRSPEDKRAAVRACLSIDEYAEQSDRKIAELCRVGHWLVGQVREQMTAEANLKGAAAKGSPSRPKSGNPAGKPQPRPPEELPPPQTGRATSPEEGHDTPAVSPPIPGRPKLIPDQILDMRGRIVPESLVPLFRFGRAFVSDLRSTLSEVLEGVKGAADESWGKGLPALTPTIEGDLKKIGQDVASAVPWCCCPHIDETGTHHLGGKCKVCVDNRGWLSRHNWHQLSDAAKQLIDDHAVQPPAPEV